LIRPGDYLAGGYPGLSWISERQDRVRTTREKMRLNYEQLVRHCSRSYGKLLWVMAEELGIPAEEVISKLAVKGAPSRLIMPTVGKGDTDYQEPEE
jgi:phage replication initiation protein